MELQRRHATYAEEYFRGWVDVDRAWFLTSLVLVGFVEGQRNAGGMNMDSVSNPTLRGRCDSSGVPGCFQVHHREGLTITTSEQNRSFQSSSICCKCWLQSVEFVGSNLFIPRCSASLRFHFVALMHSMSRLGKPSIPSA